MFRTPDLPETPKREFDESKYQEELEWLERKKEGKILTSNTDGGWVLAIGSSALIAFIIGGVFGALVAIITRSNIGLFSPVIIVFFISLFILKGDFSAIEIDPERGLLLYDGTITIGGEYRATRYRGPIEVVEASLLVRFKHFLFVKSRPYIRFMTSSGYFRANFKPEEEEEFLMALQQAGLINIDAMKATLNKKPVRVEESYIVYFQKDFDRSAFKDKLRSKREAEEHQKKIDKKIRRKKLLEKSKKYKKEGTEDESINHQDP